MQSLTEGKILENTESIQRKLKYNPSLELELKVKQLTQELNDAKERIKSLSIEGVKPIKSVNLSQYYTNTDYSSYKLEREKEREREREIREKDRERDREIDRERELASSKYSDVLKSSYFSNKNKDTMKYMTLKRENEYAQILKYNNSFLKGKTNDSFTNDKK